VDWKRQGLNKPNVYYLLRLSDCERLREQIAPKRNPQLAESGNRKQRIQESATLRNKEYSEEEYSDKHNNSNNSKTEKGELANSRPSQSANYRIKLKGRGSDEESQGSDDDQELAQQLAIPEEDSNEAGHGGLTSVGSIMQSRVAATARVRGRGRPTKEEAALRDYIAERILHYAQKLNDQARPTSSTTRVLRALRRSGVEMTGWDYYLDKAYQDTVHRGDVGQPIEGTTRRNRFPYFASVLEDPEFRDRIGM
jgi:hypothetical protein